MSEKVKYNLAVVKAQKFQDYFLWFFLICFVVLLIYNLKFRQKHISFLILVMLIPILTFMFATLSRDNLVEKAGIGMNFSLRFPNR